MNNYPLPLNFPTIQLQYFIIRETFYNTLYYLKFNKIYIKSYSIFNQYTDMLCGYIMYIDSIHNIKKKKN